MPKGTRVRNRRRGSGDGFGDVVVKLLGVLLCVVLAWRLVRWAAAQALHYWYLSVPVLALLGTFACLRISRHLRKERERRERLARLRYSLDELDGMTPSGFEFACRDLLRRDGLEAERTGQRNDQVVDVRAKDQQGRVVVLQCKHTTRGANVGVGVLYQVNGTAGPVHGADVAVVVTNGGFSRDARTWGVRHGIHLVDRALLDQWAASGRTLHTLLSGMRPERRRRGTDRNQRRHRR